MIKKSQSILGDIFVALFFLIMILSLIWIFFEHIPPQISSIKEQKACAESETLSKFFFETNESDMAIAPFVINYSRFHSKNYTNTLNEIGAKSSFKIEYKIYAFNNDVIDKISIVDPSASQHPSVYILRDEDNIIIRAGSSSVSSSFNVRLLFPLISINNITNSNGVSYRPYFNYTPSSDFKTSSVRVHGSFIAGSNEQVNISLKEIPDVVYIKDVSCAGNCSVYIGNNKSHVNGGISSGEIYLQKDFCIITRRGLIKRYNDTYSTNIKIVAW